MNEITGGNGFDNVIECAGANASIRLALDTLKIRGTMVMVGVSAHEVSIKPWEQIIHKEIQILGSENFNDNEFNELIDFALVASGNRRSHYAPVWFRGCARGV